jgi:hypothetical protein
MLFLDGVYVEDARANMTQQVSSTPKMELA